MSFPDAFTRAYIACALWSSTDESRDDGGDPLDDNYTAADLAPDALVIMVSDCQGFQAAHAEAIGTRSEQAGHDFWLTRNGHGAGFWDGDWPEPAATELTDAAEAFGEFHLLVGDDGMIHHFGGKS